MAKQRKHKKLLYVPGMISLSLLLLFCFGFFYYNKSFTRYRVMDLGLPESKFADYRGQQIDITKFRNYQEIVCKGDLESDHAALGQFRSAIKRIKTENDSINGVKIHFGSHSKYEVFVEALEILTVENMPIYMPYKNDIYVLIVPPKPDKRTRIPHMLGCYSGLGSDMLLLEEKPDDAKVAFDFLKTNWRIMLAYFALALINIFALVNFNRNKNLIFE